MARPWWRIDWNRDFPLQDRWRVLVYRRAVLEQRGQLDEARRQRFERAIDDIERQLAAQQSNTQEETHVQTQ